MLTDYQFQCEEALNVLCGALLGEGMSRKVFACKLLPNLVVKVEQQGWHQNIMEYNIWREVEYTDAAKWFAPVHWISPYGRVMIMSRTVPQPDRSLYPERIPCYFTDTKYGNWGMLAGHMVCHDYGTSLALQHGTNTKRLKKVDWYESE